MPAHRDLSTGGGAGVRKPPRKEPAGRWHREGFRMPAHRDLSTGGGAGVRKPPRKEPAGRWQAVCRLWGFDRAATSARAGLGVVVKGGLPCIIENWPPPLHSTV